MSTLNCTFDYGTVSDLVIHMMVMFYNILSQFFMTLVISSICANTTSLVFRSIHLTIFKIYFNTYFKGYIFHFINNLYFILQPYKTILHTKIFIIVFFTVLCIFLKTNIIFFLLMKAEFACLTLFNFLGTSVYCY